MMRRKTVAICPKSSLAIAVVSNTCLFLDLCPASRKVVHKGHQDVGQKFILCHYSSQIRDNASTKSYQKVMRSIVCGIAICQTSLLENIQRHGMRCMCIDWKRKQYTNQTVNVVVIFFRWAASEEQHPRLTSGFYVHLYTCIPCFRKHVHGPTNTHKNNQQNQCCSENSSLKSSS